MGSLSSQFNSVAEIWPLKDGTYFLFLALNIGKNAKIWFQNFVCEWYFGPPDAPKDPILVFLEDFMNIYDSTEGIFLKLIFSPFMATFRAEKRAFWDFCPRRGPKRAKKSNLRKSPP